MPPTNTPVPPTPTHLLVFPYLGEVTSTSAVVSWATNSAGASEVRYSLDQNYDNVAAAISSTYDGRHWHSATITHLTPDTTYYYRVFTGGDDLTPWSEITFTTGPESARHRFTFVVLGDGRPDHASSLPSQAAVDVAIEMDKHSFDLALHTGDIVHSGGIMVARIANPCYAASPHWRHCPQRWHHGGADCQSALRR